MAWSSLHGMQEKEMVMRFSWKNTREKISGRRKKHEMKRVLAEKILVKYS